MCIILTKFQLIFYVIILQRITIYGNFRYSYPLCMRKVLGKIKKLLFKVLTRIHLLS